MTSILITAGRCPFCTSDQLWFWDKGVPGKIAVACSNPACAATGPIADTEAEAVLLWNRAPRPREVKPNAALGRTLDELHQREPAER